MSQSTRLTQTTLLSLSFFQQQHLKDISDDETILLRSPWTLISKDFKNQLFSESTKVNSAIMTGLWKIFAIYLQYGKYIFINHGRWTKTKLHGNFHVIYIYLIETRNISVSPKLKDQVRLWG